MAKRKSAGRKTGRKKSRLAHPRAWPGARLASHAKRKGKGKRKLIHPRAWPGARLAKAAKRLRKRRKPVLGSLGRRGSGTKGNHKPLRVLENRLSRLSKIVAERRKNRKAWA